MLTPVLFVVCLLGLALHAPAFAQDAAAVRQEIEALRRQFEQAQQQYQQALDTLSERLQRLESPGAPTAGAVPAGAGPAVSAQAPPSTPLTPLDLVRPRQPFALHARRGPGQLLFDIGVVGDFVMALTQQNVDQADLGSFPGRENRFFPREVELLLFGQIDPYARGELRIEAAEEFEDGERELHVGLAEAHLTLLTLPSGTQAKLGLMRNRFGLLNERHREALPQTDVPNVLARFLGEEGLREAGLEASWVPPLPFYLEGIVGVFNGDNDTAFGRGNLRAPLVTGRLRTFLELGDRSALQLGVSGATGETGPGEPFRSTLGGVDVKYKLTPDGWGHALLTLAGEALLSDRKAEDEEGTPRRHHRWGWYGYAEVQPWRRWVGGLRYDWTQDPVLAGHEWAIQPYVAFMPSEFLRFRLGYKHTERRAGLTAERERGSGRVVDELLFQATFFLGAHPPHPF
jgi:hypothetical protein